MSTASGALLSPKEVADRRALAAHSSPTISMFGRMLIRAAVLRRKRASSALLAMIVAAGLATAMMNLYVDVQAKLRSEFRNYGANVVIVAKDSQSLPADALARVESILGAKTLAVPFSYAVARTKDGQSVVVVGTDFTRARQLNHWWKVSHWPDARGEALIGMRAASIVSPLANASRQPFELRFQGKAIELTPAGMLQTGAGEDSRIYLDQSEFEKWTGLAPLRGKSGVPLLQTFKGTHIPVFGQKVQQGKLEGSNVSVPDATMRLIGLMRQFEMLQKAIGVSTDMDTKAIQEVARVSA